MFLKMHLICSACGRHDSKTFASHAARASQGIIPSHSTSVAYPRAPREPSAAPSSGYPVGAPTCLEIRYQAFIMSRNRIKLVIHTHTPHVGIGESCENGTHTHTLSQQAAVDLRHHQQGSSDAEPVQAQQSEQCVFVSCTPPHIAGTSSSERNVVVADTISN